MKKIMVFLTTLIMILSLSVTCVAANGGFVKSPSLNDAPELIEYESIDDECNGRYVITPYGDRDELTDEERKNLEDSYNDIKANEDISGLTPEIEDLAKEKNLKKEKLAISDLFNTHLENCSHQPGESHGVFRVVLSADTLDKYVGLLNYHGGEWKIVKDAKINSDGYLEFIAEDLGPYAIIVNTDGSLIPSPPTGDIFPWIAVGLVAMIAVTVVVIFSLRDKEEEKA